MMNLKRDTVLKVLVAMNANCMNVTNPVLPQEQADALLRELTEDILVMPNIITVSRFVPLPKWNGADITLLHLEGAAPLLVYPKGMGTAVTGSCGSHSTST